MNKYWSTYVQTSEELYRSRALRFREDNQSIWLNLMGVTDGLNVLEVGCGGGLFCHRIKSALPNTNVTGLDFDDAHILFAINKASELNLDCMFISGDACKLPFEANTFDLCFSHTVMNFCSLDTFAAEQYRVLKAYGRMVAMDVINFGNTAERWAPTEESEEKRLYDHLWTAASQNELSQIRRHSDSKQQWAKSMCVAGFTNISFRTLAAITYCPDSFEVSSELAYEQINVDRLSELCSIEKARRMAPNALTSEEFVRLTDLINIRYDTRIEQYKRGERIWDFGTTTVIAVIGTKQE